MIEIPEQLKKEEINFVLIAKGEKKPFQIGWQTKTIKFNDALLLEHLKYDGNYGVMGGGSKNLIIVDFDNKEVQDSAVAKLPKTFTVKTGSGMLHLYYFSDKADSFKIFDADINTLADIQGIGKQGVGPGSIHPNGNKYEVIDNSDIAFINYSEVLAIMMPYDNKPKKEIQIKEEHKDKHIEDNFIDLIKSKVSMHELLNQIGLDTKTNPTKCPFHESKGGKCLGFNDKTAHCFHCDGSWNIFSFIMDFQKCSFKEALEYLSKISGMEKELEDSRKKYIEKLKAKSMEEYTKVKWDYLECIAGRDKNWSGASELLEQFILSKKWIYTTKDDIKSEVWIYNNGVYIPQGKCVIKEFLRDVLEEHYSGFIYNLVMNKIEADTFIDADKFFKTSYKDEVPVINGILNIKTRTLSEYNPEKIFFNKMPVEYNKEAVCPKIDKFLREVLSKEDDINIFYELLGFGLLDEYKYEKAFMFHGDGRNGKGKTIELIKRLFGAENCCSIPLGFLKSESFSIHELFGKRFNLAGDIGSTDFKETNMFKSATGRDTLGARRKFLRDLLFENYAKMVFACNELPMVYDLSFGFWDRWILLDFPYTFITKEEYDKAVDRTNLKLRDDEIIFKITTPEELSGLLNKALDYLDLLKKNKKFSTTLGSEEVKSAWIRKSNSFIAFCWDKIEDDYNGRISKKGLRKEYAIYCKEHKIPPKSDFVIKKVLQESYGASEMKGHYEEELHRVRDDFWEGIKWKN